MERPPRVHRLHTLRRAAEQLRATPRARLLGLPREKPVVARNQAPASISQLTFQRRNYVSYVPSPADWRDESIYFALVDRFNRGEGAKPCTDPSNPASVHGGNINGVTEKLDYIKGTGCKTIWLIPVVENPLGIYHSYAPLNFLRVDPTKGTMRDLRRLVAEAHRRGMHVVMDLVVNHTAHVFDYTDGDREFSHTPKQTTPFIKELLPHELRDVRNFSRRGSIRDWQNTEQIENGDFYNMRDLALQKAPTQDVMIAIAKWWIVETGVDGFRCDAVKHVPTEFWRRFNTEIREFTSGLGMKNYLLLGEAFDAQDNKVAAYAKLAPLVAGVNASFGTMFGIPEFLRIGEALHGKAASAILEDSHRVSQSAIAGTGAFYTNQIDGHDVRRFLRDGDDPRTINIGLAIDVFSEGLPCVYYGTEQAFKDRADMPPGIGDAGRTDMFAGGFKAPGKFGDSFDPTSDGYRTLQRYNALRAQYPALRRGAQYFRWNNGNDPGVYAFSRIDKSQEVVMIMLNTAGTAQNVRNMVVDNDLTPIGTRFVDALDPSYSIVAHLGVSGGAQVDFDVPPKGVRLMVKQA